MILNAAVQNTIEILIMDPLLVFNIFDLKPILRIGDSSEALNNYTSRSCGAGSDVL